MYPFDINKALYRRNNFGQPCVWYAKEVLGGILVYHGIIGKTITADLLHTHRDADDEIESKIHAKRKSGYKYLTEIKDDSNSIPVEESLLSFLDTYLPKVRTTIDGSVLPMKAKTYDNTNNKVYKHNTTYLGQYKINGLRCFIGAKVDPNDIFGSINLTFQSCEGEYWRSLSNLENYLLSIIPDNFLNKMVEEHYILDGEIYLPGYSVNHINHFVKDPNCAENKLLQYWCYDIAIEDMFQQHRITLLHNVFYHRRIIFNSKADHLNNKERFLILPVVAISDDASARLMRDTYINNGFEGLILRNQDSEYQYGKRNSSMIKFKKSTDGKFKIINIRPEGVKRPDIPIFVCANDINDELFEVHVGGTLDYQRSCLVNKDKYIGKYMFVEYGERSGVHQLPFHVKTTYITD